MMIRQAITSDITTGLSVSLITVAILTACSGGDHDGEISSTSEQTAASTAGVLCDYVFSQFNASPSVDAMSEASWSCSESARELSANGIPDHDVGTFPNAANPNTISEQDVSAAFSLTPVMTETATQLGGPRGAVGYVLNGVKLDPSTAGSCDDSGETCSAMDPALGWNLEALGQTSFDFGEDMNNAHVQPSGEYHYHGIPEGFIERVGGDATRMTLVGWAADGFPIYARYGYTMPFDASSTLKVIVGSYQLVDSVSESRPSIDLYELGTFAQDWIYVAGSGDLDECNGRTGITPEFPGGIYHYFATDSYPYMQRCVKGRVDSSEMPQGPRGPGDQDSFQSGPTLSDDRSAGSGPVSL